MHVGAFNQEKALVGAFSVIVKLHVIFAKVRMNLYKSNLEELDPDDGEHEEQEDGDQDDVADGLHSHDDALHHVLQPLGSVDGSANKHVTILLFMQTFDGDTARKVVKYSEVVELKIFCQVYDKKVTIYFTLTALTL